MSGTTKIEWTDKTWNPAAGCDHVSPGCDHCYAETIANRFAGSKAFPDGFKLTLHPERLEDPLRWRKPCRVFVNSMSDLFHPDVPDRFIVQVYARMVAAGWHQFQVLTKRPQRMAQLLNKPAFERDVQDEVHALHTHMFAGFPYPSVWLGTSIESDRYTFRANHLRETPARVRFLSLEPLLGPLPSLDLTGIDWVIVGGESGPGARPMHPAWARDIRDRCVAAGVAYFFKQWGEWGPIDPLEWSARNGDRVLGWDGTDNDCGSGFVHRYGKHAAGRTLDGRTWDEYPS
jgi:protein gp37